jgi:hypothetical protein
MNIISINKASVIKDRVMNMEKMRLERHQEVDEKLAQVERITYNTNSKIKLDKVIPEFENNNRQIPAKYNEALDNVLNKYTKI